MESSPETSPNSSETSASLAAQGAFTLRPATLADAASIADIYNYEVENTTATMDLVPRSLAEQQEWLSERSGAFAAIVAVTGGQVVGFASLSPYKERAAYRPTVEDSVYVRRDMGRRGIGKLLLTGVIDLAATSGFHSVMARIEASGEASRALHIACGFREVGVEIEVGRKFNRWLDMVLLQKML
jgi:phosphinothricin acetyltransferase